MEEKTFKIKIDTTDANKEIDKVKKHAEDINYVLKDTEKTTDSVTKRWLDFNKESENTGYKFIDNLIKENEVRQKAIKLKEEENEVLRINSLPIFNELGSIIPDLSNSYEKYNEQAEKANKQQKKVTEQQKDKNKELKLEANLLDAQTDILERNIKSMYEDYKLNKESTSINDEITEQQKEKNKLLLANSSVSDDDIQKQKENLKLLKEELRISTQIQQDQRKFDIQTSDYVEGAFAIKDFYDLLSDAFSNPVKALLQMDSTINDIVPKLDNLFRTVTGFKSMLDESNSLTFYNEDDREAFENTVREMRKFELDTLSERDKEIRERFYEWQDEASKVEKERREIATKWLEDYQKNFRDMDWSKTGKRLFDYTKENREKREHFVKGANDMANFDNERNRLEDDFINDRDNINKRWDNPYELDEVTIIGKAPKKKKKPTEDVDTVDRKAQQENNLYPLETPKLDVVKSAATEIKKELKEVEQVNNEIAEQIDSDWAAPDAEAVETAATKTKEELKGIEQVNNEIAEEIDSDWATPDVEAVKTATAEIKEEYKELGEASDEASEKQNTNWDNLAEKTQEYAGYVKEGAGAVFSAMNAILEDQLNEANEKLNKISEQYNEVVEKRKESDDKIKELQDKAKYASGENSVALQEQINQEMEANQKLANQETDLAKKKEKAEKDIRKKEKEIKKAGLAQNIVEGASNVAVAVTKALASGPPIISKILAAMTAAAGAVQVAILTKQYAKLEQGGLLRGRRHSQGGMRVEGTNIEVEGGEYVVNRESTGKNMGLISYINRQRRQLKAEDVNNYFAQPRSRAEVPLSSKFESGGYVTPSLDQKSEFDSKELIDAIRTMKIQPRVAVTDILRVQDEMVSVDGWSGM